MFLQGAENPDQSWTVGVRVHRFPHSGPCICPHPQRDPFSVKSAGISLKYFLDCCLVLKSPDENLQPDFFFFFFFVDRCPPLFLSVLWKNSRSLSSTIQQNSGERVEHVLSSYHLKVAQFRRQMSPVVSISWFTATNGSWYSQHWDKLVGRKTPQMTSFYPLFTT